MIRGALVGLALVAAFVAAHRLLDTPPPAAGRPTILPENSGRLQEILIHYSEAESETVLPTYRELLAALPDDVVVHVACERREDFDHLRERVDDRGRLRPLIVGVPITPWSRDRFVTCGRDLVVPPTPHRGTPERNNDWKVPFAFAELRGVRAVAAPFEFDGGDVIASEDALFATHRLVEKNPGRPMRRLLEETFGRPAVVLEGPAPDHHVEMFLTPIGGDAVMVGDAFPEVARELEGLGYRVVRLPLETTDDPRVFVTYNNVLMETRDGRRIVYMPTYDRPELDGRARAVWEAEGFEVRPIDVSRVYGLRGALHCLVNVVARS